MPELKIRAAKLDEIINLPTERRSGYTAGDTVGIVHNATGSYSSATVHEAFPLELAKALFENYGVTRLDFEPPRGRSYVVMDDLDTNGLDLVLDSVLQSVWNGRYYDPLATKAVNVRKAAVEMREAEQEVGVEKIAALANACLERLDNADEEQKDAAITVRDHKRSDSA